MKLKIKAYYLRIVSLVLTVLVSGFVGFLLGNSNQNYNYKKNTEKSGVSNSGQVYNSFEYPQIVSEEKRLIFKTDNPYRNPIGIRFKGWEDATYDKVTYKYRNVNDSFYKLNISGSEIYATAEPDSYGQHFEYVYEGVLVIDHRFLIEELKLATGIYPKTIYHPEYEIITNPNGIKMKRSYFFDGPTCCSGALKIEFLLGEDYYNFTTYSSAEYNSKGMKWIVTNPEKVEALDYLVSTVSF